MLADNQANSMIKKSQENDKKATGTKHFELSHAHERQKILEPDNQKKSQKNNRTSLSYTQLDIVEGEGHRGMRLAE
jgi:hypothetical protein